jgi:hypothetical protein
LIKPTKIVPIKMGDIDRLSDVGVEGKQNPFVMIYANSRGRKAANRVWPGLLWTTDDVFRLIHDDDWKFCHVAVTDIPEQFAKGKTVAETHTDALAFLVAMVLSAQSGKVRVFHYAGPFGEAPKISVHQEARRSPWHRQLKIDPGRLVTPTHDAPEMRQ